MLETLIIRHFAIIEELSLDFAAGMSVLTGETGAGKSILLDALGLALGERADKGTVAQGADTAEVTAVFAVDQIPNARQWLIEQDLLDDDDPRECLLRRVVTADGRSRAFINQRRVTVQDLRDLGAQLVEIHGQHAHHALTKSDEQRRLLDGFAGNGALLERIASAHSRYDAERRALAELASQASQRESRLEFLAFQTRELAELVDAARDYAELEAERNRLAHTDRLRAATDTALAALFDGDDSAQSQIAAATRAVDGITEIAPDLGPAAGLLREADVSVAEAVDTLQRFAAALEAEPARLDELESLLATLTHTARKHGTEPAELPELYDRLSEEMNALSDFDSALTGRQQAVDNALAAYNSVAAELTKARTTAAAELGERVTATMHGLGLASGTFRVGLVTDTARAGVHGQDNVSFDVATNPGQTPKPIGKTASGGELARIGLAIAVNLADVTGTPTLVFDEVDSGIGGAVAEIVGRRLRELGHSRQVLCVTHLAQVASAGHRQFRVAKRLVGDANRTDIALLDDDERIDEIARMLGGVEVTDATLRHAAEMLATGATVER